MEKKKGYSMFERDKLDPADSMRIERNIYFEEQTTDLSGLTALPLEQLQALREEYAAAEQAAFEALQEQAAAWDEQAGKTLAIDKAIDTRSYAYREPVGSYGLREAHQQPRLPNALPHIREYPV